MNTAIEFHDSRVSEITNLDGTVIVRFQPAYLHKSEGRPGFDAGTGWIQEACFTIYEASMSGNYPDWPCDILDGELIVNRQRYTNLVPVPLEVAMPTELNLYWDANHAVTVKGGSFRLELVGEPQYMEEFRP